MHGFLQRHGYIYIMISRCLWNWNNNIWPNSKNQFKWRRRWITLPLLNVWTLKRRFLTVCCYAGVLLPRSKVKIRNLTALNSRMKLPVYTKNKPYIFQNRMELCYSKLKPTPILKKCLISILIKVKSKRIKRIGHFFQEIHKIKKKRKKIFQHYYEDSHSEGRNITLCWILSMLRLLHNILARDIRLIAPSCSEIYNEKYLYVILFIQCIFVMCVRLVGVLRKKWILFCKIVMKKSNISMFYVCPLHILKRQFKHIDCQF